MSDKNLNKLLSDALALYYSLRLKRNDALIYKMKQNLIPEIHAAIAKDREEERAAKIDMQDVIKEMNEERKRDRNMRI